MLWGDQQGLFYAGPAGSVSISEYRVSSTLGEPVSLQSEWSQKECQQGIYILAESVVNLAIRASTPTRTIGILPCGVFSAGGLESS